MTRTFQNGRERPTMCNSDSLLQLQCMKFLHSGRERSQRLLLDFCTLILAQRGAYGAGLPGLITSFAYSRLFVLRHAFPTSEPFPVISSILSAGRHQKLPLALLLLVSMYTIYYPLPIFFWFLLERSCNDMATNEQASG